MRIPASLVVFIALMLMAQCSLFEEPPSSPPLDNAPPETYLSISSSDTIYAQIDSIVCDTTGACDTVYSYYFAVDSLPDGQLDTLANALQTILASTQTMYWWGEDADGEVIGYYCKWNYDDDWQYTTGESETFIIPIRQAFDIFRFEVKAMDSDSLVDSTPAELVLPIKNTAPVINFRYRSNPVVSNPNTVHKTFPTRTFVWDVSDADGLATVDSVFYALDDTTAWIALDAAAQSSVTLTNLTVDATHVFHLKARDIAGAESDIIQYPDSTDESTPNTWIVMDTVGDVLLVDDFADEGPNKLALKWYQSILDTITPEAGIGNYSVWEIGEELPYSEIDVFASLSYFKHIVWYAATSGIETYGDASNSIYRFVQNGGNVFINITDFKGDTTFLWFPLDTIAGANPQGRFLVDSHILSKVDSSLELVTSRLIPYRFYSFGLKDTSILDPLSGPTFTPLYQLPPPGDTDPWKGEPILGAEFDHRNLLSQTPGRVILTTIPFHDGLNPYLEGGDGSVGKFISWALKRWANE
ncbi:MAG: hypothetical protein KAU50_09355 [Candidatus Marinimicrobia bacterium]|nr:hypothetical protein [Candidatus Neomarinimicrobiota bacterium]